MAKSLRSKRKRFFRQIKREKNKVKENARLLETLGIAKSGKDTEMKSTNEDSVVVDTKQETTDHVQEELSQNNQDTNEDVDMDQGTNKTSNPKIKVDRKQLLKRLGKKKHFKKKNKNCKW